VGGFHQGEEQVGDPHRRMDEILAEDGVVGSGDVAAEDGDDGVIDLILSEVTERLNEGATDPACCGMQKGTVSGCFCIFPHTVGGSGEFLNGTAFVLPRFVK